MTDIETMIKALRLLWIPRLIREGYPNWKFVPDLFLRNTGAFIFSDHVITTQRTLKMCPLFITTFCCSFMKALYECQHGQDTSIKTNKLVQRDGIKPFLWTKQTWQIDSNRGKRLVEKIKLANFIKVHS